MQLPHHCYVSVISWNAWFGKLLPQDYKTMQGTTQIPFAQHFCRLHRSVESFDLSTFICRGDDICRAGI